MPYITLGERRVVGRGALGPGITDVSTIYGSYGFRQTVDDNVARCTMYCQGRRLDAVVDGCEDIRIIIIGIAGR